MKKTSEKKSKKTRQTGRRSEHSAEEIRELILAASEKIVEEQGYSGLSARKIANEIGYNVAMLYHYYDNLDEIILRVNARTLGKLYTSLQNASAKCRTPRSCLIALSHAYVDFAFEQRHLWGLIYEHIHPEDEQVPEWFQHNVDRMFALIEEHIKPLAPDMTTKKIEQASQALWCGVHGICVLAMTRKLELDIKEIHALTESLVNNYLKGFTSTES